MLYKKIKKLLNIKNEYSSKEELFNTLLKIDKQVKIIDDYFKIYLINDDEFIKLSILNSDNIKVYL